MNRNEKFLYFMCFSLVIITSVLLYNKTTHTCSDLPTVIKLQQTLKEAGYNIKVDGKLGSETTDALNLYHEERG